MRGLVPKDYKYLGPGNDLKRGRPTDDNDYAAYVHDNEYKRLGATGFWKPYVQWSGADERFLKQLKPNGWATRLAKTIFEKKRDLAHRGWLAQNRTNTEFKQGELPWSSPQSRKRPAAPNISPHERNTRARRTIPGRNLRIEGGSNIRRDGGGNDIVPPNNSLPNLRAGPMADGKGSGNTSGLKETPVDDVHDVHRGPPTYTFASLPFIYEGLNNVTQWSDELIFRMTSPYDGFVSMSPTTDVNAGTGAVTVPVAMTDVNDVVNIHKASWFDYYASMYKY